MNIIQNVTHLIIKYKDNARNKIDEIYNSV